MRRDAKTVQETFDWRGITCRVTTTRDWRIDGWTLVALKAVHPLGIPFPLGHNGTWSHGLEQEALDAAGGAVAYCRACADKQADHPTYLDAVGRHRQGDLFKPAAPKESK